MDDNILKIFGGLILVWIGTALLTWGLFSELN